MASPFAEILDRCPACGSSELEEVFDGEMSNIVCRRCYRCWHVAFGSVHLVDPATCPGCPYKATCEARWLNDA